MRRITILAAAAAALVAAAPAAADTFAPGSDGLGDPFFPNAGNGGYDVKHYSLDLDYERADNTLDARATIVAKATQNLSSFNLDLRGFEISDIDVNGRDARFSRSGEQELTVTPRSWLRAGLPFVVRIDYAGEPAVANPTLAFERLAAEGEIIDFFSDLYGPYPFSSGGGVVDNGGVGYALESQTKSMYDVQGSSSGAP